MEKIKLEKDERDILKIGTKNSYVQIKIEKDEHISFDLHRNGNSRIHATNFDFLEEALTKNDDVYFKHVQSLKSHSDSD